MNALEPMGALEDDRTNSELLPVVHVEQSQALAPRGLFGTDDPAAVMQKAAGIATILRDVLRTQGLISNIQGKEYPKCEAWTLLGNMLGVYPVLTWTKPVEGGWEARVEAKTSSGMVVGAAEAQCLRSERNWEKRDDFALRSMAQTRATAKCLRMPLGFVMTLSGYSVTPAEEMGYEPPETVQNPAVAHSKPQNRSQGRPEASTGHSGTSAPSQEAPKPRCGGPKAREWMIEKLYARPGEPGYKDRKSVV